MIKRVALALSPMAIAVAAPALADGASTAIDIGKIEKKVLPAAGSVEEANVCATVLARLATQDGAANAAKMKAMEKSMAWAAAFERLSGMAKDSYALSGAFFDNQYALGPVSPASLDFFNEACLARSPRP